MSGAMSVASRTPPVEAEPPAAAGRPVAGRCGGTVLVLLVDDRDDEAERISRALSACRDFRFEIDHVQDPEEACRLWSEGSHQVAIFDFWLGRGTSMGLFATLAEDARSRPLVVMSNLPGAEVRRLAGDGGDFFIHSKQNLTPLALAMTLGSALALWQRIAVTLDA